MNKELFEHIKELSSDDKLTEVVYLGENREKLNKDISYEEVKYVQAINHTVRDGCYYSESIEISITEERPKLYHGTTIERAKQILRQGYINPSNDIERISHGKTFLTNDFIYSHMHGAKRNHNSFVVLEIDTSNYELYTYNPCEYFILGKISKSDIIEIHYINEDREDIIVNEEQLNDLSSPKIEIMIKILADSNLKLFHKPFGNHGIFHSLRVWNILHLLQSCKILLTSKERAILSYAAMYHDIGRTDEIDDINHGANSWTKLCNSNLELLIPELEKKEDIEILKFIIENHCIKDNEAIDNLNKYSIVNIDKAMKLFEIFKDVNSLDLYRFGKNIPPLRSEKVEELKNTSINLYDNYRYKLDNSKVFNTIQLEESIDNSEEPFMIFKNFDEQVDLLVSFFELELSMLKHEILKDDDPLIDTEYKVMKLIKDEPIRKINQYVWKYATETVAKELRKNQNVKLYFVGAFTDKKHYVEHICGNKYKVADKVEVLKSGNYINPRNYIEMKKFTVELEVLGKLRDWNYNILDIEMRNVLL